MKLVLLMSDESGSCHHRRQASCMINDIAGHQPRQNHCKHSSGMCCVERELGT